MPRWLFIVVPLALVALLAAGLLWLKPLDGLTAGTPPAEDMAIERVMLDDQGIHVWLRATGSEPVSLAQVQVDGAYWTFKQNPPGPIGQLSSVRLDIDYPWVDGDAHALTFVTGAGATFDHEIGVARATPKAGGNFWSLVLLGLIVGPIPVGIGLMFRPAIRSAGQAAIQFLLGLTIGLLAFLLIDTVKEGLEAAENAIGGLGASSLFWAAAGLSLLGLMAIGRREGKPPEGLRLALFIAIGIGLHNLGEGLAIGAALTAGEVALASYLVMGFALHNVTEGVGIAVPLGAAAIGLPALAGLAAVAGVPAILGTLMGVSAYAPHLAALAFGIGAGAIAQVIIELSLQLSGRLGGANGLLARGSVAGITAGVAVMYVTSLVIQG